MNSIQLIIQKAIRTIAREKFCAHDYVLTHRSGPLGLGCIGIPVVKCKKCGKVNND